MTPGRNRIVVAMSGGVDSSVAAALLVRAGHDVVGITLQLNPCQDGQLSGSCCGIDSVLQARKVADQLGIEHGVLDCREAFESLVLRPAWDDYRRGRTPSPCVLCNERVKFGLLLERARRLGASRVASGHYARLVDGGVAGARLLQRGADLSKDQSYFLFSLAPEQLASLEFPLGGFSKPEVRGLARELGLATAERADSQDACLGGDGETFGEALRRRFEADAPQGPIVDPQGRQLGLHDGLHRFTVGQRRGLGVALGRRVFVTALREADAAVVVSEDETLLQSRRMEVRALRLHAPLPARAHVQIRSRHRAAPAALSAAGDGAVIIEFDVPQRAITPGQAAVFYDGDRVVGGGFIERPLS